MTSILELSSLAGGLKKVSGASGGEWAGPCPFCGGEDRFRVWPDHPSGATGGRWMCRGCGRQGDGLAFVMEKDGVGYPEACRRLGTEPKGRARQNGNVRACPAVWAPEASTLPGSPWSAAAEKFVAYAEARMATSAAGRAYAESRGLTPATVAALRIGWSGQDLFHDRAAWGLPPEVNERTGRPRKVWLPAGLVVPTIRDGVVVAVKIRRSGWIPEDERPKYAAAAGGSTSPMILARGQGKPVVIVESELDAILVAQEARDLVCALAMRTAKAKPDAAAHELLKAAPVVLVATDADAAGETAWPWWREAYNQAVRWPVLAGKDVGDMAATPGLVRAWVDAGMPDGEPAPGLSPEAIHVAVLPPPPRRSDALPHGEPCPYSDEQLAAFLVSHGHLICCPNTRPAWNWRYRDQCETHCKTPCSIGTAAERN